MKQIIFFFTLFTLSIAGFGQADPETAAGRLGPNPLFIIDSQKVSRSALSKYNPEMIAAIKMLYDTSATKRFGETAKDGAVIIETREFARRMYVTFFRKTSQAYDSLYNVYGNDTSFVYILNDKVQRGSYEGNLSAINNELYLSLEILTSQQLFTHYNIRDRHVGILVRSKRPKDLYNADKKF